MKKEDIKKALSNNNEVRTKNNILNTVKKGSRLIFKSDTADATVFDVANIVMDIGENVAEARLFAKHDDGHESYHTYRYDGMSHHSEVNDIKEIQNRAQTGIKTACVQLPIDLYDDLVDSLLKCLNNAINDRDTDLEAAYRTELDRCNEIQKGLLG